MHMLSRLDIARGTTDGKAVLQHLFALCYGLYGHFMPEGDVVAKCQHRTIRQCYSLANLEVMERHSHIVVRVQSNYRLF